MSYSAVGHGEGDVGDRAVLRDVLDDHVDDDGFVGQRAEHGGGDARLVLDVAQRDLGLGPGERDARNDLLFHDLILIANQRAGHARRSVRARSAAHPGSSKVERTTSRTLCAIAISTERIISTLAPSEAISSISSKAILVEPLGLGVDARVGGVDAVDIGIDVAAVGLDRRGHGDRRGIRAAAAERRHPAGLGRQCPGSR